MKALISKDELTPLIEHAKSVLKEFQINPYEHSIEFVLKIEKSYKTGYPDKDYSSIYKKNDVFSSLPFSIRYRDINSFYTHETENLSAFIGLSFNIPKRTNSKVSEPHFYYSNHYTPRLNFLNHARSKYCDFEEKNRSLVEKFDEYNNIRSENVTIDSIDKFASIYGDIRDFTLELMDKLSCMIIEEYRCDVERHLNQRAKDLKYNQELEFFENVIIKRPQIEEFLGLKKN